MNLIAPDGSSMIDKNDDKLETHFIQIETELDRPVTKEANTLQNMGGMLSYMYKMYFNSPF